MPLRVDGLDRGPYAVHVKRHKKFGKHCTVLTSALPFVDWLVSFPEVRRVHLGILAGRAVKKKLSQLEVIASIRGKHIRIGLNDGCKSQLLQVEIKDDSQLQTVIDQIAAWDSTVSCSRV